MKESHDKITVYAVCKDRSIYSFASFTEYFVGDDIYGTYQIGKELGNYKYDLINDEGSGVFFNVPEVQALQDYINGVSNTDYDRMCKIMGIQKENIIAFYTLVTPMSDESHDVTVTKITANNIKQLNDDRISFVPIAFVHMMLLDIDSTKFDGNDDEFAIFATD